MKSKVTIKELLASQIICTVLIAMMYWILVREEWKDYYSILQLCLSIVSLIFFIWQGARVRKYNKEFYDELAAVNLKRCDSICLKVTVTCIIVVMSLIIVEVVTEIVIGYILVFLLIALAIIRTVSFLVMDSKGV